MIRVEGKRTCWGVIAVLNGDLIFATHTEEDSLRLAGMTGSQPSVVKRIEWRLAGPPLEDRGAMTKDEKIQELLKIAEKALMGDGDKRLELVQRCIRQICTLTGEDPADVAEEFRRLTEDK